MRTRIEVDEMGRHIIVLPDDVVEDYQLEHGDSVIIEIPEEGVMEVYFQ